MGPTCFTVVVWVNVVRLTCQDLQVLEGEDAGSCFGATAHVSLGTNEQSASKAMANLEITTKASTAADEGEEDLHESEAKRIARQSMKLGMSW